MKISDLYISALEAAKILDVTQSQISHLCRTGQLEGAEKIARNWIMPKASVETFVRKKRGRKKFEIKKYKQQILNEAERSKNILNLVNTDEHNVFHQNPAKP